MKKLQHLPSGGKLCAEMLVNFEWNIQLPAANCNRGYAKVQLEDYRGAMEDFSNAIELDSKDTLAYNNRGFTKYKLEDFYGAVKDYNKAIELNASYAKAYFYRGLVKIILNQKDIGCLDLSKAGELGFENAYEMIKKLCK